MIESLQNFVLWARDWPELVVPAALIVMGAAWIGLVLLIDRIRR